MNTDGGEPAGLYWTSHALVDAGIAGLTAFAKKQSPEAVTLSDLDSVVDFAEQYYLGADMSKTIGILFTINRFQNPSVKSEERRRARVREAVGAFRRTSPTGLPPCAYCGRPALTTLHRDDVPMLLGRSIVNFYPGGDPGLPICGLCQTCVQGLSLGAPRV